MGQLTLNTDARETGYAVLYAKVAVPRAVEGLFTYRVPKSMAADIKVGCRVIVSFGKKGLLTAIVHELSTEVPEIGVKEIVDLLETIPTVNTIQLKLHQWVAGYYMALLGEVTSAALPSGLKISSESRVQLSPTFELDELYALTETDPDLELVLTVLSKQDNIGLDELLTLISNKNPLRYLRQLQDRQLIIIYEALSERYVPKKEPRVRITEAFLHDEEKLHELAGLLEKAPHQYNLLMAYLRECPVWQSTETNEAGLSIAYLLERAKAPDTAIKALIRKGFFERFIKYVPRFSFSQVADPYRPELNDAQAVAYQSILAGFEERKVVLLHGVTGAGKTELYIKLAQEAIEAGQQVLYLLPEIALTAQMVNRLHAAFGSELGIYHSRFSDNERVELWHQLQTGQVKVVLGVRSAVFLPFDNLGLIIVDEEHDTSYKQYDPAPRYNGRDVAIMLASYHKANVVLGSATPAVESYYKAVNGPWKLVKLDSRYGQASLPTIDFIDLRKERSAETMQGPFSSVILDEIDQNARLKNQTILFQNRRGYAPMVLCQECNTSPECPNCDISLTYHQVANEMRCHYCGYKQKVPKKCAYCGSGQLRAEGYGTEQIEEQLTALRPKLRIRRMDQDTTRQKNSFNKLVQDLENDQVDVLVGTQMVAKGFDFKRVSLVGIFDIDRFLHLPNYRAKEQTYQLLTQVAGRAGRHYEDGKVMIQTNNPAQPLLALIQQGGYSQLYDQEITERAKFYYPPFVWLIQINLSHLDRDSLSQGAVALAAKLRYALNESRVLGPADPPIVKVRNYYRKNILIKIEKQGLSLSLAKRLIKDVIERSVPELPKKGLHIAIDVDPIS